VTELTFLKLQTQNWITQLTLSRPPVNAINRQVVDELNSALDSIQGQIDTGATRVLVIGAEGAHFSAGTDMKERQQIPADRLEMVVNEVRNTFLRIYHLSIPVIAVLHGSALGSGLELALAADLRVLANDAKVGLPEAGLAIIPAAGGTQYLPRLIGYSKALFWLASGKIFTALEAFEAGVADFLVKKDELSQFCHEMATTIARNGPLAVRSVKQVVREGLRLSLPKGLDIEKKYFREIIASEDRIEGMEAFIDKRMPHYRGR